MELRVASFNVRNMRALDLKSLWWLRRSRLARAVRALRADVLGLQEAYARQHAWLEGQPGLGDAFDHALFGRTDGQKRGESCPIWARRGRFELQSAHAIWFSDEPSRPGSRLPGANFPRIATIATVAPTGRAADVTAAQSFDVVNVHLDEANAANRRRSCEQLANLFAERERALLVLGDFNADTRSDELEPLHSLGLHPVLGPEDGGTGHNYRGAAGAGQIDNIFVSPEWVVTAAWVARDAGHASDHWPVVADLNLPPTEDSPDRAGHAITASGRRT